MATKRLKNQSRAELLASAVSILTCIESERSMLDQLNGDFNARVARLKEEFDRRTVDIQQNLAMNEKKLIALMKHAKGIIFDGTDVVNLVNGSLIRNCCDKVSIPRDALAKCEELGFAEVIKVVKSLDREAVEKWPDERLFLIGAERKPKEEFSYNLKEKSSCTPC